MARSVARPTRVKWRAKWLWMALATAAGAVTTSCAGPATTDLSGSGAARLDLTPAAVILPRGSDTVFIAAALTAAGDTADVTVTWRSTGGTVADLGADGGRHLGRYRAGMFCGDFTVAATARPGNYTDSAVVTVSCPVPVAGEIR